MYHTIKIEYKDLAAVITINRPKKLNALSNEVFDEFTQVISDLKTDFKSNKIRGIILTGAGEKAFIAGADISEMTQMSPEEGEAFGRKGQEMTKQIESLPVPVIGCINGYAFGGGNEVAMSCDFIYATLNARFGQPEINLGLIPGFGGCVRLKEYVGLSRAKEMILTGDSITAMEAKESGLVSSIFPDKKTMVDDAIKRINNLKHKSPHAISICKKVMHEAIFTSRNEGFNAELLGFKAAFTHPEHKEGTRAFLEKRKPEF